ncbi:RNA polymerase II-associated [Plectosphaerella plurivora]|uniref:RNA polymerase II-associated n=1 Tax=Plectosphaerella plurivora TaxID=936078 RepID=A0A9P8VC56_9PEZI|nr:RNA polymerase II-associated [Plectosphaerella plurivora]
MSSSAPRNGERMIHQDFIARIRYANNLPPPPNPPKLLDIPNTGLSSGQYTNPSFASRLARDQPLNIEADAELGMPLDLVGMPNIFEGDESSIQPPAVQPQIHPHDRPLLRPLATLGRPKGTDTSVSFLRRTEYISSMSKRAPSAVNAFLQPKLKRPEKRRVAEPEAGSPAAIRRKIEKSFEIAQRYAKDPRSVPHPTKKPGVHVVESYPFIPDLDAFPDAGAYVTVKLQNNPVPASAVYDRRLLSSILRPIPKTAEEEEIYAAALEAYERDPDSYPKPSNLLDYQYFLPADAQVGERFRASFDIDNPDRAAPELYTHSSKDLGPCFQFTRLRAYETTKETEFEAPDKYSDELIVAFSDLEGPAAGDHHVLRQRAAYFYPVMQRATIRPQREKNILRTMSQAEPPENEVNQLDIAIADPGEEMRDVARRFKANPLLAHTEAQGDEQPEDDRRGGNRSGTDLDAEGEED